MENFRHLRHQEYRSIYWLLGECCEMGRSPEAWTRHIHEFVSQHTGSQLGVFIEGGPEMAHGRTPPSPKDPMFVYGRPFKQIRKLMNEYRVNNGLMDDPALPVWATLSDAVVTRARHELASNDAWNNSQIVNDYFHRTGFNEMVLATCPSGKDQKLLLNFWRPLNERPFSAMDTEMVHLIAEEVSLLIAKGRLAPLHGGFWMISPRLKQVLALLCEGKNEREIAAELNISRHTAHNHIQHLHRILGVTSRGQLIALAFRYGMMG